MSYNDFVQTFTNGCNLIFNGINDVASSLMSNYIFITILGLTIVISLFWLFHYYIFEDFFEKNIDKYVNKQNMYERYSDFRDVRYDYNNNNIIRNENEAVYRYQINRNAFKKVFGQNVNGDEFLPNWLFNEPVRNDKLTNEEQKEFDDLIDKF